MIFIKGMEDIYSRNSSVITANQQQTFRMDSYIILNASRRNSESLAISKGSQRRNLTRPSYVHLLSLISIQLLPAKWYHRLLSFSNTFNNLSRNLQERNWKRGVLFAHVVFNISFNALEKDINSMFIKFANVTKLRGMV